MISQRKLGLIHWVDSRQTNGRWQFLSDIAPSPEPVYCTTVGWQVSRTTEAVAVAQSLGDIRSDEQQASGVMIIPTACITSIEELATGDDHMAANLKKTVKVTKDKTTGKPKLERTRAYDASAKRRAVKSKAKRVVAPARAKAARGRS